MDNHQIRILLIEDDEGHSVLIEKNLRRAGVLNEIVRLTNGQQALDFLVSDDLNKALGSNQFLILLDLNLPEVDGFQVLQRIKGDSRTKGIPVVILTTTENPAEINRCYQLGCNFYISKPVEYDQFCEVIRSLGQFLKIVKFAEEE